VVALLVSDDAQFITGQTLMLDGGHVHLSHSDRIG
jgi:NAD(P)-dependent dehydrogenase (short-subunit alcohol dehydrogenase family)